MRFKKYYFKETIDWKSYVADNDELKIALEVMKKIQDAGYEALLVGGFVRDLLMDKKSDDIDLTTNATPEEVEKIFDKTISIGKNKEMGVSVVPYKGFNFEISTYRSDSYDDMMKGTGADKVVLVKSFEDDSARRDFTINSLGIDANGNVVDYHGGLKDIKGKKITAVGDPKLRFQEDLVRVLRGVRFASKLGFEIDPDTLQAMKDFAPELDNVAKERVSKELMKMAGAEGKNFARAIKIMDETGILEVILPEVFKLKSMPHNPEHHPESSNVYGHVIEALKSNKLKDPLINLSILFHDLGKIKTHEIDEKGIHRYFGHAQEAESLIDDIAKRLKLDNKTRDILKFSAINHMKFHSFLDMNNSTIYKLMDSSYFEVLKSVALADVKARGNLFDKKEWDQIEEKILKLKDRFKNKKAVDSIRKVVNGNFVLSLRKDIKPGPKLGDIIKKTVNFILDNNIDVENDFNKIKDYIININLDV